MDRTTITTDPAEAQARAARLTEAMIRQTEAQLARAIAQDDEHHTAGTWGSVQYWTGQLDAYRAALEIMTR